MRFGRLFVAGLLLGLLGTVPSRADAAPSGPTASTAGAFSTPQGDGFWIAYENGRITTVGAAQHAGDTAHRALNAPVVGGASTPSGRGYWLVARDGGIFTFGDARFYGSTGHRRLNQPVFSMTPTKTGRGYWLVARDGGIFTFGDARFFGSAGALPLQQPIVGITTSPSGNGYRMIAADGGVFNYGDVQYYGSLPGRGIRVTDVVGVAPTPSNRGYWIARANGAVHAFGDAVNLGSFTPSLCNRVTGIIANRTAVGYRLVTASGYTVPFGNAPGGSKPTGAPPKCGGSRPKVVAPPPPAAPARQEVCRAQLATPADYQAVFNTRGPVWSGGDGAFPVDLGDGRRLWLFGDTFSGPADATRVLPGARMVHNSVAIEHDSCIEFRLGGTVERPTDFFPAPKPGQYFWPLDGVVDGKEVHITALRVTPAAGPSGFRWRIIDTAVQTIDRQSLQARAWKPLPLYAFLQWGGATVRVDNYVYVYARSAANAHYVARASAAAFPDGVWEFFDGTGWNTNQAAIKPMEFRDFDGEPDTPPQPSLSVERYGSGFLASTKRCDILCDDVTAWYSSTPFGPWQAVNPDRGRVATTSAADPMIVYGGRLVPAANGELMALWSVNGGGVHTNKLWYGPRFASPENLPAPDELFSP